MTGISGGLAELCLLLRDGRGLTFDHGGIRARIGLMRYVATQDHEAPEMAPLQLERGDVVMVGERATRWPEFVFVTAAGGTGWVPARHLSAASGPAAVIAGYDTTELPVAKGEVVTLVSKDDLSGWWWCRSAGSAEGWVPLDILEPADE